MYKKIFITAGVIAGIISAGIHTEAAIAVIDTQNIAQQIKTYAETVKVVTNTAQQITLQAKELAALPNNIVSIYTNSINNSISNINNTLNKAATVLATTTAEQAILNYWNNKFPKLDTSTGDWVLSEQSHRAIVQNMSESLSEDNRKSLLAYKELLSELDENQKQLNNLLELNKNIEGNKQGQQIANQIAGISANIKRIELSLKALDHKHKIESDQAKITERQNDMLLADQRAAAEQEFISNLNTTQTIKAARSPFKDAGLTTWF